MFNTFSYCLPFRPSGSLIFLSKISQFAWGIHHEKAILFGSYDGYKRSKAFSSGNICFEIAIVLQSIYKTKETFEIQNIVSKTFYTI